MTNMGLDIYLQENDMEIVKTAVGDRYVLEEMLKSGYVLGGEQSGHIIFQITIPPVTALKQVCIY